MKVAGLNWPGTNASGSVPPVDALKPIASWVMMFG